MKKKDIFYILVILLFVSLYIYTEYNDYKNRVVYTLSDIKDYDGEEVIILNNNEPEFESIKDINTSFEIYGDFDSLGRCTYAYANIGKDLMPTGERESIYEIKPTGWHSVKYDFIPEDHHLFNRCHLIAHQLTAENANPKNLITCTRHMNTDVMQEYEIKVGNYIRRTNNHVLYRVTPIFDNDNLVAKGVQIEALSLEDNGKGIKFNVFIYNIQPGIIIDYKTGESKLAY